MCVRWSSLLRKATWQVLQVYGWDAEVSVVPGTVAGTLLEAMVAIVGDKGGGGGLVLEVGDNQ